jgi:outer membrane protein OmpA-like peptidoglycan-associated protein/tetratricopeptide (TPR) repeat protein
MRRPLLLIILIFVSCLQSLFAQEANQKLKELFLDGEYFFLSEDYEEALYSYNTLYKRGYADNGNINYRIGQCYLNIPGEKGKSIAYLEKAVQTMTNRYTEGSFKETRAPYDALFYLGTAYRITNQLDKAIAEYEKYKAQLEPRNVAAIKLTDKEISACNYAREMMKHPINIKKVSLGRPVNTPNRDYFPAVSGDESVLVYNTSQKFYQAVFFCKKINKKWSNPINITPEIESDGNQFVSSLSYDGSELYLRLEDKFQANIMVSKYEDGKWAKSRPLNRNINTKYWEGNACVTKDGSTLYFSSNRPGGAGALDLYKSVKKPNGDWGPAVNLGSVINTEYNEDAPFITEDGKRLYFVSQGHNTMGGYDVFYSDLKDDGTWSEPVNPGYPINTTDDELFYCPVRNGNTAYFAGYMREGYGSQDIFKVDILPETEVASVTNAQKTDTSKQKSKAELVTQYPDSLQKIKERVLPQEVVNAITESQPEKKEVDNVVSRSIFFDFNSAELGAEAKRMLEHLCIIMKNSPELKIQFVGSTDSKGSENYNIRLSERRARAARSYLISKGINTSRITIKGVGETNFIALNSNPDGSDNPDGRKYNRRVDIQIMESKNEELKIEEVKLPDNLKVK